MLYKLLKRFRLPRFEDIYVQAAPMEIPYRGKAGVSVDGRVRCDQIASSIEQITGQRVHLRTWAKASVLYPYRCEKIIHWVLDRVHWKYKGFKGSTGWTEWYIGPNILTFFALLALLWHFDISEPFYKAVFVLIVPAPLDQILLVYLVWAVQWAIMLTLLFLLCWFAYIL